MHPDIIPSTTTGYIPCTCFSTLFNEKNKKKTINVVSFYYQYNFIDNKKERVVKYCH